MYITVGFSTPKGFHLIAWLIRKVEHTKFSHVYFKFWDAEAQTNVIYQASGTKVNAIGEARFDDIEIIVDEFDVACDVDQFAKLKARVIAKLGIPYGWKQLLGIGWVRFCAALGVRTRNPLADGGHTYICAEFVEEDLKDLFQIDPGLPLDQVSPNDIYDALMKACGPGGHP